MGFPGNNTGVGCHSLLWGISWLKDRTVSLVSPALAGGFFSTGATWEAQKGPRILVLRNNLVENPFVNETITLGQ